MWFNNLRKQFLFFFTSDAHSNRKRNLCSRNMSREPHIMTMFIPALFDKKLSSSLIFWKGDVINDVVSAWNITCTTIHFYQYTCKLLFVWYQFILFKSSPPPGRNGRHLADDICKCIFLNMNLLISIKISLKFIPNGPVSNITSLVHIMAWRWLGDKPLSESMLTRFTDTYMQH